MVWGVTAELERFNEAEQWFNKRIPEVDTGNAEDRARGNSFRIAGMLELDAVSLVFKEIAHALEKGQPFGPEFKQRVTDKLGALAPKGAHLETVFRNWTQTSYNTGRYYQLSDPEVTRFRPYWMYDAILDGRTTQVCKVCNGTIKRFDDAWWDSHWAPCHHRCRSSIRALRRGEALERGITADDPAAGIDLGTFGKSPKVRDDVATTTPKQEDHDPAVWAEFKRKQLLMEEELRKAQERADKQRPQHWFDAEYQARYGENAGRAVAWGRAMEERGKGVAFDEAKRQHVEMTDDIGIKLTTDSAWLFQKVAKAQRAGALPEKLATLGDLIEAFERGPAQWAREAREARALAALIGQRSSVEANGLAFRVPRNRGSIPQEVKDQQVNELGKVRKFFSELSDKSVQHADKSLGYVVTWTPDRAHFDKSTRTVLTNYERGIDGSISSNGAPVLVHEMMHGVEEHNPRALAASSQFLERRTIGEPLEQLKVLSERIGERLGYRDNEFAREDKFFNPYMGKEYVSNGQRYATEVSSMAAEEIYRHAAQLLRDDPEAFWFALGQMAGDKVK